MEKKSVEIYACTPLSYIGDIPVFSSHDEYILNYEEISRDHVVYMEKEGGTNPFMDECAWEVDEKITIDLIRKYGNEGDVILDVGVGLGRLLSTLTEFHRYGLDISKHYLERARNKGIEVCLSKIEDMPYKKDSFDVVVCTDVLEHVVDLNLCIEKILFTLKKGGFLVIRTPYREDLSSYLSPEYPYRMAHLRNFDEFGLRIFFEKVFGMVFLDMVFGAYPVSGGTLKKNIPVFGWACLAARTTRLVRKFSKSLGELLARNLYYPTEINLVFKKKEG